MTPWTETYRGTVAPWECDVTEHFTVGCYFDRIEQAAANLAEDLGLAEILRRDVRPRRFDVRFSRELRAGDSFHVESAAIGSGEAPRFGHRVVDSANRETATWVVESWGVPVAAARWGVVEPRIAVWDGPPVEPRAEPAADAALMPSTRGRVRPADLDENGGFSLAGLVHRFTDACIQTLAAIGMTGGYMEAERRGYSTFELALAIDGAPRLGDPFLIETGIAHLGKSSVRFAHRLIDPRTGKALARLGQFGVQLDLDARRPAPLPEPIRARAAQRLVPLK